MTDRTTGSTSFPRKVLWSSVAVVALSASSVACNQFTVENFAGSKILLNVTNDTQPVPVDQHVELWVREATSDDPGDQRIVRVLYDEGDRGTDTKECTTTGGCTRAAYTIVLAVDFNDGCTIDSLGHLLWMPDAVPDVGGPAQGMDGATAVIRRMHQLIDLNATPALAFVTWDDNTPGNGSAKRPASVMPGQTDPLVPSDRLAACNAYWAQSPYAYSGNPRQLTAPVHGQLLGATDWTSASPPQIVGGVQIITDWALPDAREIWLTQTDATIAALDPNVVDCASAPTTCRGSVLLDGTAGLGGYRTIHFELTSPTVQGLAGAASIQTNLDQQLEEF
jgi:hypothetical protein